MPTFQCTGISKSAAVELRGSKNIFFYRVVVADTFFKKLVGLIFSREPCPEEGLLLDNCNSIHTLWMRFPVDVLFLDKNECIVYLIENLRPFRFSPVIRNAVKVLEIAAGEIKKKNAQTGDVVFFK